MRYDARNRATLAELAPNTQAAALKWYEYCIKVGADILIYEARRTEAEQRENVAKGVSQTMRSYHLVGQALDFVSVDVKGNPLWASSAYSVPKIQDIIQYAKTLGFTWGGDWTTLIDKPHLQFNYKGYGTDLVLEAPKPKLIYYVTGAFPDESDAAQAFEDFMKAKKWWYKKEVQQ